MPYANFVASDQLLSKLHLETLGAHAVQTYRYIWNTMADRKSSSIGMKNAQVLRNVRIRPEQLQVAQSVLVREGLLDIFEEFDGDGDPEQIRCRHMLPEIQEPLPATAQ